MGGLETVGARALGGKNPENSLRPEIGPMHWREWGILEFRTWLCFGILKSPEATFKKTDLDNLRYN